MHFPAGACVSDVTGLPEMNSETWEGRVHALEHMHEQHPMAFVIYVALFVGIVLALLIGVVLVSITIAIYQTVRNRKGGRIP